MARIYIPVRLMTLLMTLACTAMPGVSALAASISVQVVDRAGQPVSDAVVYAEPDGVAAPFRPSRGVVVEQRERRFHPLVTVIQTGTSVTFPNNDSVRHHLYSFSPAKTFELKLYSGMPRSPVVFDKPGTVNLGCNIHDQMIAYIKVVATPYFGKTDTKGEVQLEGLPAGKYHLKAWHFNLLAREKIPEQTLNLKGDDGRAAFTLALKAATFDNDNQYQPKQYK